MTPAASRTTNFTIRVQGYPWIATLCGECITGFFFVFLVFFFFFFFWFLDIFEFLTLVLTIDMIPLPKKITLLDLKSFRIFRPESMKFRNIAKKKFRITPSVCIGCGDYVVFSRKSLQVMFWYCGKEGIPDAWPQLMEDIILETHENAEEIFEDRKRVKGGYKPLLKCLISPEWTKESCGFSMARDSVLMPLCDKCSIKRYTCFFPVRPNTNTYIHTQTKDVEWIKGRQMNQSPWWRVNTHWFFTRGRGTHCYWQISWYLICCS